ncbi:alcohol dehydrogenase catalytic domain-containing protein [Streptococcus pluranimalium]|uniref:alcohol dehydrogenase catalytic domain-containing protein n=1 Tax=Streptococcus pluranimalium TaxID=82348 RepID=UPI0039FC26D2
MQVLSHPGDRNVLEVTERPIPQIKEGWSLVKIEAFGINRSEIFTRNGYSPSVSFPRILGIECVGSIVETSDEAVLPVGHKVISIMGEMGRDFDGSYLGKSGGCARDLFYSFWLHETVENRKK